MNRRRLLRAAGSGIVASTAFASLPGFAADREDKRPLALLLPLTGAHAQLGLSMRQAVLLAEKADLVQAYDTGGTAQGAADAAAQALRRDPGMILGPLTAEEVPAVTGTVAGRAPIISFTNDALKRAPGSWVFGITPAQVTSAILRYARGRGVRVVSVVDDGSAWSAACAVEAGRMEHEIGLRVSVIAPTGEQPLFTLEDAPDAVLLPGSGNATLSVARRLRGSGVQLLGTLQAIDNRPDALDALDGAWIAGPDPAAFGDFATEYEARNGGSAGTITALAYDAAKICHALRQRDALSGEGLLTSQGFRCVTGAVRFRTDGSVARDFAILLASANGYEKVAASSGA
ncbi:ABC transporter substrate-binding protein [Stakelama tenebrarum]|uniref:Uncharacterized protein n=1 Tax=Stakelama tenebrarum TaxID=2711215 RepID=A0A6G6Y4L3_9SPHN|nr:ABC transporter substrate-binding protein [Sphingosinithalassobacter tenebrarum]QIG79747.1 hypothetical protein G5C33_08035 [Sphingosinithalassobacter tenebrarum]